MKMEVCAEKKAEEADAKCRQCEIEAKMEIMMAAQSGLMDKITELENALAKEREKTQAMGERLRVAEEEVAMVVKRNPKSFSIRCIVRVLIVGMSMSVSLMTSLRSFSAVGISLRMKATPRAFVWFAARPQSSEETRASLSPRFPPCATEPSDESYVAPSGQ
ncbi:hypothetical protein HPB50_010291 [Hyalomma asiaticum]|uniref:Uncharacterized protein n=1 Tax=Hyalomma asiaticum TaxID=266040 RepID=A0ACB7RZE0_HYAAI|nr:hypothetical protein HPB50_010291 [Hyalomma asiaticum]